MNNKQLPPLPDPHIGLPWRHNAPDGSIHSSAFTAEQMREYALQAIAHATQTAEVTDDLVEKATVETFQKTGADLIPEVAATFARAILALRPVQVPMTDREIEPVAWLYIEDGEVMFGHPNGYRPPDARPLVFGDTHPAQGEPDGYALVPIEPTDEMLNAAFKFESQGSGIQGGDLVDVWKAMLAASPAQKGGE